MCGNCVVFEETCSYIDGKCAFFKAYFITRIVCLLVEHFVVCNVSFVCNIT